MSAARAGWAALVVSACIPAAMAGDLIDTLPKGSIVAFMPDTDSGPYTDLGSLRSWLKQRGWAICDGSEGTPNLHYRFLLGTERPADTGQRIGQRSHEHQVTGETDPAQGSRRHHGSGHKFPVSAYPDGHRHRYGGVSEEASNLPPSMTVMFIMKTR